ncbi:hypothetical protein GPECTOR_7g998 [Gonium pectorale]|uniref:Fido domain-containing protein n=1 Tax=Gonium pectorale TaxID=33097 RepID=A0A150GV29_GONPE|nr:hypothetical protein GPECTOR_7g998 [Gonium pectorale]|eukprot:KXZ53548.1 hypothetical protein GPECTOR_7g998 [Gonium pectorale]
MGNKTEGTLPAGVTLSQTCSLVEGVFSAPGPLDYTPSPAEPWSAEGAYDTFGSQITQHAKALRFLCFEQVPGCLSSGVVRRAHAILMWGAREGNQCVVKAGEYRSTPAHSDTGYVYPEPSLIDQEVERVVAKFNENLPKVLSGHMDPELLAAQLFYDMVTAHPFENGNGRLCRLLAAFALMAAGDPFPTPLTDGHKDTRSRYRHVLRHADKHGGDVSRLAAHIMECRSFSWQSLMANDHVGDKISTS